MKRFAMVSVVIVAIGVPVGARAATPDGHASRACPARVQPAKVTRLRVAGRSCATAVRIARAWTRRAACDPDVPFVDRRCRVSGWRCRASRVAIVTTRTVSCSARSGRLRFLHREE